MKITTADEIFERIEEDALEQANTFAAKGNVDAAEAIGVMTLIRAGVMTQLNLMGMNIWNRLKTPLTIEELAQEIGSEFEVPAGECIADIREFVDDLVEKGFLRHV